MSVSEDDVLLILELFEASDWDELALTSGDVRLNVSKRGGPTQLLPPSAVPATAPEPRPAPVPVAPASPEVEPADDEPPPGILAVRAPTLGTFFVAPRPGAPPFVALGDAVAPGDTVAIVEVMKLMNPVLVDVAGEIAKVCARNNEMVEREQVLFWLKPAQ